MTEDEVLLVNRTARTGLTNAVTPRYIIESLQQMRETSILDYGAGPKALHTHELRKHFSHVDAYEIGKNVTPGLHVKLKSWWSYDVVMASNVLNVQPDLDCLHATLDHIYSHLRPWGMMIANFPKGPRKIKLTDTQMWDLLRIHFQSIEITSYKKTVIFVGYKGG